MMECTPDSGRCHTLCVLCGVNKFLVKHIFLYVCIDPEKWTSTSGTGKSVPVSAVVEGEFFL
jgi:hypothetical protein